jgi:hypothetical protein
VSKNKFNRRLIYLLRAFAKTSLAQAFLKASIKNSHKKLICTWTVPLSSLIVVDLYEVNKNFVATNTAPPFTRGLVKYT